MLDTIGNVICLVAKASIYCNTSHASIKLGTLSSNTPYTHTELTIISINQSINSIRVHHTTEALGHNMVQNSTRTT